MEILDLLTVTGLSALKILPAVVLAIFVYHLNFLEIFISVSIGGIGGSMFFAIYGSRFRKWLKERRKRNPSKKKVNFRKWRRIFSIWKRFGLYGIAALTPPLLSPPIGTLIAVGFREPTRRIILFMTVSTLIWATLFGLFGKQMLIAIGHTG